jgi:large repetitive protein
MKLRALALGAAVAASLAAAALVPAVARAGTYSVSLDTTKQNGGWTFSHDDGFAGCSLKSRPGPCADADVPSPTPLRIFGFGQAPNLANAWWEWEAPDTTTIASGSVSLSYRTATSSVSAYMKARLRSETFPSMPQLHAATDDGTTTWSIPAGNQVVGIFLKTDAAHDFVEKWNNNIAITGLAATLTDDTAPAVDVSGPLADGAWHNEGQPVPLTVAATDAGAGVAHAAITSAGTALDSDAVAPQSGLHAGLTSYSRDLTATPAALGDGSHTLNVEVTDAAGERTVTPVVVNVDAHAPVATGMAPAVTTDQRAEVSFSVDPGPSGLGQFDASVDGTPMTIAGDTASYAPASDLAYGTHTVTWHATDGAGNVRDSSWTFAVNDAVPPVLSDVRPDAASSSSDATPAISVAVADAGVGVDAASIRMTVDGVDVTADGSYAGGRFSYTPASDLAFGAHTVSVSASDTAGNRSAPLAWSFDVADETPPAVTDRTPVAGSTVPGASAIGFAVRDSGSGVDPDTLHVVVDGSDVTSWGTLASGQFRYAPGSMAPGVHTVSVAVADRAGNVAGPIEWEFAVASPADLHLVAQTATSIVAGGKVTMRFLARDGAAPMAGTRVVIAARTAGGTGFHTVRTMATNAAGAASWIAAPLRNTVYRAELANAPTVRASRTVTVRQRVALLADHLRIHRGGAVRLTGLVSPAHPGARVSVQVLTASGWRTVARPRLGIGSHYTKTVVAAARGRYVLRVIAPATPTNAAGRSRTITVRAS